MSNKHKLFKFDLDKELMDADVFLNKRNIEKKENRIIDDPINLIHGKYKEEMSKCLDSVDSDLLKYKKQLKSVGFPEIGVFAFPNLDEKEKTLKFFDFVIIKKTSENEEKIKFKKQLDGLTEKIPLLQNDNSRLEKEIMILNEEIKKYHRDKKDNESKLMKFRDSSEKQLNEYKIMNVKLNNKCNTLVIEKKSIEEKLNKISENYQKIINKNNFHFKANNHIDMIDNLKRNDTIKLLSKVKGTEKFIDTLKNGFNESLRELLFEISALKNFIYEMHLELVNIVKQKQSATELEYNLLSLPFLDTVSKIKSVFRQNFERLSDKNKIEFSLKEEFNYSTHNELSIANETQTNNISKIEIEKAEEYDDEELEHLKNKWIKTLMNAKNEEHNNIYSEYDI
jgi:hypothetical protein